MIRRVPSAMNESVSFVSDGNGMVNLHHITNGEGDTDPCETRIRGRDQRQR